MAMDQILENQITELMEKKEYEEALSQMDEHWAKCVFSYEYYYYRGFCMETLGFTEDAYYAYKMALYLGKESPDYEELQKQFDYLCEHGQVKEYQLGKACQHLVERLILSRSYELAFNFLQEQLYDQNPVAARIVLSEDNMLYDIMLEITLCEKNRYEKQDFYNLNCCAIYGRNLKRFRKIYQKIKLLMRRIWFGLYQGLEEDINRLILEEEVSIDMLAVICKYSIREEYWLDAFQKLASLISERDYPVWKKEVLRYADWLSHVTKTPQLPCQEERKENKRIRCERLYYEEEVGEAEADDLDWAILFCSNDVLYEEECFRYIKCLHLSENIKMKAFSIWDAPSMAAGYNFAIKKIPASYRLYIHQDSFLLDLDIVTKMTKVFHDNPKIGMLGISGSTSLGMHGHWYEEETENLSMNLYQDAILNILKSVSEGNREAKEPSSMAAFAMDGYFLATAYDFPWRADLFDHWHYYDISQCHEFRANGYETCFLLTNEIVLLHENTLRKEEKDFYENYRDIFVEHYLKKER